MHRRIGRFGELILLGLLCGLIGCANRPIASHPPQRPGAAPSASHARAQAELMSGVEAALRIHLASTDAVVLVAQGVIHVRVVAQALFPADAVDLSPGADEVLRPLAFTLAAFPATSVDVRAYTDSLDAGTSARSLTQQRADSIAAYLSRHGIASDRIRALGEGQSRPISENTDPEGRGANRRVEIFISALSS